MREVQTVENGIIKIADKILYYLIIRIIFLHKDSGKEYFKSNYN